MKYIKMLVDNSTALTGLVLAVIGLLTAFDVVNVTEDQIGKITAFLGALVLFLAAFLTTAKRTVVTQVDNSGVIRNGAASTAATGTPTDVTVNEDGSLNPQVTVDPAFAKAA